MQNEIPLFQKIYDFYKIYYQLIDHFPKKSREVLAEKIEKTIIELLEIISRLIFAPQEEKVIGLKDASVKVDFLKVLFRLCYDLKIINQKKYIILEDKLQEMGRMIGGWIRSLKQQPRINRGH